MNQPVKVVDRIDLNEEIKVQVDTHLTGLGMTGLVATLVGMGLILLAGILFLAGYPERWYALDATYEASRAFIRAVVLVFGSGVLLMLTGTSLYFYGRAVLGSGAIDRFSSQEPLEGEA